MKIAFCISGQPRSWNICHKTWFDLFRKAAFNSEIDVFFHFWNSNSLPLCISNHESFQGLTDEERVSIVSALNPKRFQFEDSRFIEVDFDRNAVQPVPYWLQPQFNSLQKVANLKRQYEIENNFEYDVVVKLRGDLFFSSDFTESFHPYELKEDWLFHLEPSTIYSMHSCQDIGGVRLSDMFFLSDSLTFDHIAQFKKCFRYLDLNDIFPGTNGEPPERFLYWYLDSIGIKNHPMPNIDCRLYRTKEYLDELKKLGRELGQHEICF
jgi:hypothetical protein